MYQQKRQGRKLLQRLRQKTNLKLIIAASCAVIISVVLIMYFNLIMVKEMKARNNLNAIQAERPVDMNVVQIKIDSASVRQTGNNYIIAKPLTPDKTAN